MLLESYLKPGQLTVDFDYTQIRPAGEPIKTFGGTAAGPEPLQRLHEGLRKILAAATARPDQHRHPRHRQPDRRLRRLRQRPPLRRAGHGLHRGQAFLDAKNYGRWSTGSGCPDPAARAEWGWMSNNSVAVNVGDDLTPIIDGIARNGEPGVIWLDVSRQYGRLIDPPNQADHRVAGYNPCAEQSLESFECCTLVETYLNRHDDLDDFKRPSRSPTSTPRPSRCCRPTGSDQRDHAAQPAHRHQRLRHRQLRRQQRHDHPADLAQRGLRHRPVLRRPSTPSGCACASPSRPPRSSPPAPCQHPGRREPRRALGPGGSSSTAASSSRRTTPWSPCCAPPATPSRTSAYTLTPPSSCSSPSTPRRPPQRRRGLLFEKANLAVLAQRYWSDNSVSVTLSFDPETEAQHVGTVLHMHEGQLKTVSFLPRGNAVYQQMPYQESDADPPRRSLLAAVPDPLSTSTSASTTATGGRMHQTPTRRESSY
jgi:ribonucleoside-triphosphate reductase